MRCFLWMLFLPGSLGDPVSRGDPVLVTPKSLSVWEGSCVIISCNIKEEYDSRPIHHASFAWYFQPLYDNSLKEFSGKLLYNSNQTATEVRPEFRNRVKFMGDLQSKNCGLKISQLHQNDSGTYGIRLYWISGELVGQEKWIGYVNIEVHGTPSELIKTVSPEMEEYGEYTVSCSVPYYCFDEPIKLSIQGLEDHRVLSPKTTPNFQTVQTELSFQATWKDHGKQLTCLLKTHDGGEVKKRFADLVVKYAPKGVQVTANPGGAIREGNHLTLKCIVNSSNPAVSYQWYKDNRSWPWVSQKAFHPLKRTDSGSYRCKATNQMGSADSENLMINVLYPPKASILIIPPTPIREEDTVVLSCSATGNPSVNDYEWHKSSTSGIIAAGRQLRFEAIQARNSDTYRCVARNAIGHSNASVTLNVHYFPKDVQLFHLNHLPIKEGDQVILKCSVGSSYPSSIHYNFWGPSGYKTRNWDSTLTVSAIAAPRTSYRCEACNSIGCTFSPTTTLDVLYGPKDVKLNPEPSGSVLEGISVHLTCHVGMANPNQLSYTWYKDGQLLPRNPTENVLFIQNAHSMDSGIYHCVSKNNITKAESPTIKLEVNYGPRNVHLTLDKKAVTEGMDIHLTCDNDAYPPVATYRWYWKGEELFTENSKILVLRKIKIEQSGEYHCRAFNKISNKESQLMTISVSYSRATVMKRALIGLGVVLAIIILLGLLLYGLKKRKKTIHPDIGITQRPARGSFFVRKAKQEVPPNNNSRQNECRADRRLDCQNEEQDGNISYARLQFHHSGLNDRTIYSSVMQPNVGLHPSEDSVIYSVVKKPAFRPKNDTKVDYENVVKKEEEEDEEELHYSSLVNLAPPSRPIHVDLETDSESEGSIQYAALKH